MIYDILFIAVDLHKVVSQWATTGAIKKLTLFISVFYFWEKTSKHSNIMINWNSTNAVDTIDNFYIIIVM